MEDNTENIQPINNEPNFRLRSQMIFLTYPRCDISKEELLNHLKSLRPLKDYVIGKELHEDGYPHLHCWINYNVRLDTKNCKYFDYKGFHCNIKKPGNRELDKLYIIRYCAKGNDFITNIDIKKNNDKIEEILQKKGKRTAEEIFQEAINKKSKKETIEFLEEYKPEILIKNFNSLNSYLDYKHKPIINNAPKKLYDQDSWINIPKEFLDWKDQIGKDERCRLLIVIGKPNIGKSTWFKSLGPHASMTNEFNITEFFQEEWLFTLFDDMNWAEKIINDKWKNWRNIFMGKDTTQLTDKYQKKVKIETHGKPCVIIANYDREYLLKEMFETEEYKNETDWVYLNEKLFITNQ